MNGLALFLGLLVALSGCLQTRPMILPVQEPGTYPPMLNMTSPSTLKEATRHSLRAMNMPRPVQPMLLAGQPYSARDLKETLSLFLALLEQSEPSKDFSGQIEQAFDLYEISEPVLFTGYYAPLIPGSFDRTEQFRYPLYRCPADVNTARQKSCLGLLSWSKKDPPYFSRQEIDYGQALSDRGIELIYLDDPIERFFLHVQGSGSIRLPDHRVVRVQYDCSNGRPYTSIGQTLVQAGALPLEEATLSGIKGYLAAHREQQKDVMSANERYIFFRTVPEGPMGVDNIPLTALQSLATDPHFIPAGSLLYYVVKLPISDEQGQLTGWREQRGFALSQDVGQAIRGPFRADIYLGEGLGAETAAGNLNRRGKLYILVRKRPTN